MGNFEHIKVDNRLNKPEIQEVEELAKDKEKLKVLLETNKEFKDFINIEYRRASFNALKRNGRSVKDLQKKLWFKWKEIDWRKIDWFFWKQTFLAVIKFQKENGLVVDWFAWTKTQEKLFWNKSKNIKKIQKNIKTNEINQINQKKFNNIKQEKRESYSDKPNKLANYVERKWPKWKPWYCWANVWNILLQYWIEDLPRSWRHWYRWSEFLDNNPNFRKEYISNPSQAKPWWILVYDKEHWRSKARQNYGHVEIALNDWKYYYWTTKNHPWWSIDASINNNSWFIRAVYYPV